MKRTIVGLSLALGCALTPVGAAAHHYTDAEVSEALTLASARYGVSRGLLRCIAGVETGWTFDHHAIGDRGASLGLYQLHARGLRPLFYDLGYASVWSPYDSADFTAWAISRGMGSHWAAWSWC